MAKANNVQGNYSINATGVNLTSKKASGPSVVNINSHSSNGNGVVNIGANSQVDLAAGPARVALSAEDEVILLSGGSSGTVSAVCGDPSFRQSVEISNSSKSTVIQNGKIPGMAQSIKMDGESAELAISNGELPVSPTITMSATSIILAVGPTSSIEISAEGITISGLNVSVEGTVSTQVKGAMVQVSGDATAEVKAAMVMIN